jgi:hypothetical protein
MTKELILGDGEKFIIYSRRYFNKLFHNQKYVSNIQDVGCYVVMAYISKELNQSFEFVYDFRRSERVYYQLHLQFKKNNTIGDSNFIFDPLAYLQEKKEPGTIEASLALYKEFISRSLMPLIEGKLGISEILK